MSEPTIDEMLEWIGGVFNTTRSYDRDRAMREAVRAILEQHQNVLRDRYLLGQSRNEWQQRAGKHELEAIRAFVVRVADRMDDDPFINAKIHMTDELAAMEKEAE